MRKIIFLLILPVVAMPLSYDIVGNKITVESRFIRYEFSTSGVLEDVYHMKKHIYSYDSDGFDTPSTPVDYKVWKDGEDVFLQFIYEGYGKTFHFIDSPYYEFVVQLSTPLEVHLPRVWYPENDRYDEGLFISFSPKKYVSISRFDGEMEELGIVKTSKIKVYLGPGKKTLIKGAFPEDYDRIMKLLKEMYGVYDAIFYSLVWFFNYLYKLTGNFGWTIILFTFIVRLVLYPLYHAQTKSMIKMRKIQKDVERIRKKYKDPKRQQEELMKLYKEKGVNPMSGCLMMLIQLPIFFMLWGVLRYFEEEFAYGKPFLLWKDLSVGGFKENILLVLITIAASFYTTLITSQDTRSAWQGIMMSTLFPFLFISLPSGLFIYYTTNTLIQLVVTYYIYRRYNIKGISIRELFGLPKKA